MVLGGLALALLAIFLPPLAVLLRTGCDGNFLLNIILLFLGWIPAVLHAWYVILAHPSAGQRRREQGGGFERWRSGSGGGGGSVGSRGSDYSYARSRESAEDPGYRPQMGYAPTYAPAPKVRY
ncbi:hypothetical protein B0A55_09030 [Friedmanniomyces simplex]|uniref:Plasma membrane proteolipid 3 n=1 Tax=Friedmanniomyces simplex TaxID=329884 RepID=A0A4U0WW36_9PEZI|nr:hypothetical protein B0A55_09030 [Friedmanniomyces simplex]